MPRPTLQDVAREAGVSHTTVSWALRGDPRISGETRSRVVGAAQALGYVPNETARSLARGRTSTIALVSPSFSAAYETELLRGIEDAMARDHDDHLLVQYSTGAGGERAQGVWNQLLHGQRADGVICLSDPPPLALRQAFAQEGKPLVVLGEDAPESPTVRGRSDEGARLATEHLLAQGCRRPGIVTSSPGVNGEPHCNPDRLRVFQRLCLGWGVPAGHLEVGRFRFEEGRDLAPRVRDAGWDGVFCAAGDLVAAGLLLGLQDLGLRVPTEVRVVGYDDLLVASLVSPGLSTIAQPLYDMGQAAVDLCFDLLGRPAPHQAEPVVFPPVLVRRATS